MIRKYFLFIGIACVILISVFMNWAKHHVAYEHIKRSALAKLPLAEQLLEQPIMPTIEIAGPNGDVVSLPQKGQFLLINIWSTKCNRCNINLASLSRLQRLLHSYKENWKIISVSVDKPEDLEKVTKYIKRYKLSGSADYYDAHGTLRKYIKPKTMPAAIIVNDRGQVLYKIHGKAPWLDQDIISFLRGMKH